MNNINIFKTQIRLHDTDAAGLLFFARQFNIIHDAYEQLLEKMGLSFAVLLKQRDYFLPIVHAESDFKAPLFAGDRIEVHVSLDNIGNTSFTLRYALINAAKTIVGTAKTVHVTISQDTGKKIDLPMELRQALEQFAKSTRKTKSSPKKSKRR